MQIQILSGATGEKLLKSYMTFFVNRTTYYDDRNKVMEIVSTELTSNNKEFVMTVGYKVFKKPS